MASSMGFRHYDYRNESKTNDYKINVKSTGDVTVDGREIENMVSSQSTVTDATPPTTIYTVTCAVDPTTTISKIKNETTISSLASTTKRRKLTSVYDKYDMSSPKRGFFLIINNRKFKDKTRNRTGSDLDAARLYLLGKTLGFDVEIKFDLSGKEMEEEITNVVDMDHNNWDCFFAAFLSHGDSDGIEGVDGEKITVENLLKPLKIGNKNRQGFLVGKPKICVFQACRGTKMDPGVLRHDGPDEPVTADSIDVTENICLPTEADYLLYYSTSPDYYSFRDQANGTLFIKILCDILKRDAFSKDLLQILTLVNRTLAEETFNYNNTPCKQMPVLQSCLTRTLKFTEKPSFFS